MQGFFSYARVDAEAPLDGDFVDRVQAVLERQTRAEIGDRTFSVWQDRKALLFGDDWKREIEDAVQAAPFFFVLLTPGWVKSDWCRKEFRLFRKAHPGRPAFLVRFRAVDPTDADIAPHAEVLEQLNQGHKVNLQNPVQKDQAEVTRILDQLAQNLAVQIRVYRDTLQARPAPETKKVHAPPPPATRLDTNDGVPLAGGHFSAASQDQDRVLLNVGIIERAETTLRTHGRVVFGISAATLSVEVTGGRIEQAREDLGRHDPPVVEVVTIPLGPRKRIYTVTAQEGTTLAHNPLCNNGEGRVTTDLFSVAADGAGYEVSGKLHNISLAIFEAAAEPLGCGTAADEAARMSQLRKLAELVLKKHGSEFALGSHRRDA